MITVRAYDRHVEQLFELIRRLHAALTKAEVNYRIVGGMAVFFQVSERDPDAARVTRDVDVAIDRNDIQRIARVAADFGFRYQHSAGIDMLVDAKEPKAHSAVHLLYIESVPGFSEPTITAEGILLAPVPDLVRMKLTSFRLKDKVHLLDMDSVGLITPGIEATLSNPLRNRLQQLREEEAQSTGAE
jgi:hypothetical protein